jgi:hypothetical protein
VRAEYLIESKIYYYERQFTSGKSQLAYCCQSLGLRTSVYRPSAAAVPTKEALPAAPCWSPCAPALELLKTSIPNDTGKLLGFSRFALPIANCQLPIADCQLPIANCQLPIAQPYGGQRSIKTDTSQAA